MPGDRPAAVVAFDEQVVEFFTNAADLLGVPKSVAAIYGIVFASPAPLSFAEIEARLDISKGSISQGLRVLREVGALRAVGPEQGAGSKEQGVRSGETEAETPSARGVCFEPDLEMRKLVGRFLENRVTKQLDAGSTRLASLKKSLAQRRNGEGEVLKRRLQSLSDWHSKARTLMPLAKTFLKLGG